MAGLDGRHRRNWQGRNGGPAPAHAYRLCLFRLCLLASAYSLSPHSSASLPLPSPFLFFFVGGRDSRRRMRSWYIYVRTNKHGAPRLGSRNPAVVRRVIISPSARAGGKHYGHMCIKTIQNVRFFSLESLKPPFPLHLRAFEGLFHPRVPEKNVISFH